MTSPEMVNALGGSHVSGSGRTSTEMVNRLRARVERELASGQTAVVGDYEVAWTPGRRLVVRQRCRSVYDEQDPPTLRSLGLVQDADEALAVILRLTFLP